MPVIARSDSHQTVITTFEMTPGTCQDLLDMLRAAYEEFISKQPGFIAAGLHVNDAPVSYTHLTLPTKRIV